ncbi:MAG: hypothetical protein OXM02_00375 [Bacteroidota bacterium]|nr:hypothetical protein [Bacteroidota bacterium]MDE2832959.1 hypothetical protein [Bacteroidota bacterium]
MRGEDPPTADETCEDLIAAQAGFALLYDLAQQHVVFTSEAVPRTAVAAGV